MNVGGTGATLALALLLWRSSDPGYRQVGRLSLPTQIFQINEPIFFGLPIVLNPIFMVPYVLNALIPHGRDLRADDVGADPASVHQRALDDAADPRSLPGHRRRLACSRVGCVSIVMAMAVYYPVCPGPRPAAAEAPGTSARHGVSR